jgi:hypothetical protein
LNPKIFLAFTRGAFCKMTQSHIPTNARFDVIKFEDLSMESTWVKLGEGSFGKVYKAQYLGLPIAIKEIIPRTDYDGE